LNRLRLLSECVQSINQLSILYYRLIDDAVRYQSLFFPFAFFYSDQS